MRMQHLSRLLFVTGERRITVVRSPKSGVNFFSLGNFEQQLEAAYQRSMPAMKQVGAASVTLASSCELASCSKGLAAQDTRPLLVWGHQESLCGLLWEKARRRLGWCLVAAGGAEVPEEVSTLPASRRHQLRQEAHADAADERGRLGRRLLAAAAVESLPPLLLQGNHCRQLLCRAAALVGQGTRAVSMLRKAWQVH
jgi:hypothetical protein